MVSFNLRITSIFYFMISLLIHILWTRLGSVRFDSVRFGSSPTSRHYSVVRPRVRHAKHEAPRAGSRCHIIMMMS
ncbi:hypothetical protein Hanom_Chr12g01072281 [Helianthus anomalus]